MDRLPLKLGFNILREDDKCFYLPVLNNCGERLHDGAFIDIIIMDESNFSIESGDWPIKFDRFYGNRVLLNTMLDRKHINPQFVFNAEKQMWHLMNVEYVMFAEQEIGLEQIKRGYEDEED